MNQTSNFTSAIQYMGLIMRQETLNIDYILSMVEIVNNSYLSAKDVVTILEEIFKVEKSAKIVLATQVLEYLVKNGNRNFHQAANKESFQKSILGLLKRQRGKMSIMKQLRSNGDNWCKIESRVLYLIQLWYDAFILEESKYPYIINNYKILRKENIMFPPRNVNEKSLLAVQTQSPIFDNIQSIAESDREKFKKRLNGMGLSNLSQKFENRSVTMKTMPQKKQPFQANQVDIDSISEKIAIIRSQDYDVEKVMNVIEEVKKAISYGKVKPTERKYWEEVKIAAEELIRDWEEKNSKFIEEREKKYLQEKMMGKSKEQQRVSEVKPVQFDLLTGPVQQQFQQFGQFGGHHDSQQEQSNGIKQMTNQVNLLDL